MFFYYYQTKIGNFLIKENREKITNFSFFQENALNQNIKTESRKAYFFKESKKIEKVRRLDEISELENRGWKYQETSLMRKMIRELNEYFEGNRTNFDIPLDPENGTPFRLDVWKALRSIPYGETRSYREIAEMIGNPLAARGVGNACGQNQILILIPCHRVVSSHGKLGGFSCGLDLKRQLLKREGSFEFLK